MKLHSRYEWGGGGGGGGGEGGGIPILANGITTGIKRPSSTLSLCVLISHTHSPKRCGIVLVYSGTSDKGPSEIGTTSLQRTLVEAPCQYFSVLFYLEIGTTSLQGAKPLPPKCPLFGGSTVVAGDSVTLYTVSM